MLDGSIKKKLEKYTISPLSIWTPLSVDNYIYYCATNRVWSKRSFVRFSTNNASTLFLKYTYKLLYAINVIKWIDMYTLYCKTRRFTKRAHPNVHTSIVYYS